MSDVSQTIKVYNGFDYDRLYPKTIGNQVILKDYKMAENAADILPTDSINVATGKLEKRTNEVRTQIEDMASNKAPINTTLTAPTADSTTPTAITVATALTSILQTIWNKLLYLFNNKANLASPAFTGTPTVPTAAQTLSNTQAASLAFVHAARIPASNNTAVLGSAANRWKDLFIQGNIAYPTSNFNFEVGIWTPRLYGSTTAGTNTYYWQYGYYYKMGDLIFIYAVMALASKGGTAAGNARIDGLPRVVSDFYGAAHQPVLNIMTTYIAIPANTQIICTGLATTNSLELRLIRSGQDILPITMADIGSVAVIVITGMYASQ